MRLICVLPYCLVPHEGDAGWMVPCPCGKCSCLLRVLSPTKMQLNQAYALPTTGAGRYKQFGIDSGSPIRQIPEADSGTYPMRPSQKKAMGMGGWAGRADGESRLFGWMGAGIAPGQMGDDADLR